VTGFSSEEHSSQSRLPFRKSVIEVFWRPTELYMSDAMFAEDMTRWVEMFLTSAALDGAVYVDTERR
jgi:hypothetical protein